MNGAGHRRRSGRATRRRAAARRASRGGRRSCRRRRAPSGCRRARARASVRRRRTSSRNALEERLVPALAPRHRAARVLAPLRPRARARRRRTPSARPGSVICRPTPTRCRSGVPAIVRKRAVSWLSSRFHELSTASHGTPARKRRSASTAASPRQLRDAGRDAPELLLLLGLGVVAQEPRPERAQEAGVVHDAVPAAHAEVGPEVVAVLGDQQRVADLLARPLRDVAVQVDVAVAADHVRDVDAPAVEAEVEVAAQDVREAAAQLVAAPVELGQRRDAEPRLVAVRDRRRRRCRTRARARRGRPARARTTRAGSRCGSA